MTTWDNTPSCFRLSVAIRAAIIMISPDAIAEIVDAMLAHGCTDGDIKKFLGGNLMRLVQAVWV